eukprot:GHVH01007107.1.p2 GENE.GHVH01007107.1~~GHVH01007107.1.p2  ORF type:complete len:166 (-),score=18.11 GHVH01007107.1:530-1027(-)
MLNSIIRQKPFDERDIVIYFSPTWGLYHSQTILAGGLPVDAPLSIDSSNKMDVDLTALNDLIVTYGASRIRAIIVCSPNNPSSTEVPLSDIELIAEMILTFHLDVKSLNLMTYNIPHLRSSRSCRKTNKLDALIFKQCSLGPPRPLEWFLEAPLAVWVATRLCDQ